MVHLQHCDYTKRAQIRAPTDYKDYMHHFRAPLTHMYKLLVSCSLSLLIGTVCSSVLTERVCCRLACGAADEGEAWLAAHHDSAICSLPEILITQVHGDSRKYSVCNGITADIIYSVWEGHSKLNVKVSLLCRSTESSSGTWDFIVCWTTIKMTYENMSPFLF